MATPTIKTEKIEAGKYYAYNRGVFVAEIVKDGYNNYAVYLAGDDTYSNPFGFYRLADAKAWLTKREQNIAAAAEQAAAEKEEQEVRASIAAKRAELRNEKFDNVYSATAAEIRAAEPAPVAQPAIECPADLAEIIAAAGGECVAYNDLCLEAKMLLDGITFEITNSGNRYSVRAVNCTNYRDTLYRNCADQKTADSLQGGQTPQGCLEFIAATVAKYGDKAQAVAAQAAEQDRDGKNWHSEGQQHIYTLRKKSAQLAEQPAPVAQAGEYSEALAVLASAEYEERREAEIKDCAQRVRNAHHTEYWETPTPTVEDIEAQEYPEQSDAAPCERIQQKNWGEEHFAQSCISNSKQSLALALPVWRGIVPVVDIFGTGEPVGFLYPNEDGTQVAIYTVQGTKLAQVGSSTEGLAVLEKYKAAGQQRQYDAGRYHVVPELRLYTGQTIPAAVQAAYRVSYTRDHTKASRYPIAYAALGEFLLCPPSNTMARVEYACTLVPEYKGLAEAGEIYMIFLGYTHIGSFGKITPANWYVLGEHDGQAVYEMYNNEPALYAALAKKQQNKNNDTDAAAE
jgi:hypothetical protein